MAQNLPHQMTSRTLHLGICKLPQPHVTFRGCRRRCNPLSASPGMLQLCVVSPPSRVKKRCAAQTARLTYRNAKASRLDAYKDEKLFAEISSGSAKSVREMFEERLSDLPWLLGQGSLDEAEDEDEAEEWAVRQRLLDKLQAQQEKIDEEEFLKYTEQELGLRDMTLGEVSKRVGAKQLARDWEVAQKSLTTTGLFKYQPSSTAVPPKPARGKPGAGAAASPRDGTRLFRPTRSGRVTASSQDLPLDPTPYFFPGENPHLFGQADVGVASLMQKPARPKGFLGADMQPLQGPRRVLRPKQEVLPDTLERDLELFGPLTPPPPPPAAPPCPAPELMQKPAFAPAHMTALRQQLKQMQGGGLVRGSRELQDSRSSSGALNVPPWPSLESWGAQAPPHTDVPVPELLNRPMFRGSSSSRSAPSQAATAWQPPPVSDEAMLDVVDLVTSVSINKSAPLSGVTVTSPYMDDLGLDDDLDGWETLVLQRFEEDIIQSRLAGAQVSTGTTTPSKLTPPTTSISKSPSLSQQADSTEQEAEPSPLATRPTIPPLSPKSAKPATNSAISAKKPSSTRTPLTTQPVMSMKPPTMKPPPPKPVKPNTSAATARMPPAAAPPVTQPPPPVPHLETKPMAPPTKLQNKMVAKPASAAQPKAVRKPEVAKPPVNPVEALGAKPEIKVPVKPVAKQTTKAEAQVAATVEPPAKEVLGKPVAKPQFKLVAKSEAKQATKPDAAAEVKQPTRPEANLVKQPDITAAAKPVVNPEAKPVVKLMAMPAALPVAEAVSKPGIKPTTVTPAPQPEVKPVAKPEAKLVVKPAAKLEVAPVQPDDIPAAVRPEVQAAGAKAAVKLPAFPKVKVAAKAEVNPVAQPPAAQVSKQTTQIPPTPMPATTPTRTTPKPAISSPSTHPASAVKAPSAQTSTPPSLVETATPGLRTPQATSCRTSSASSPPSPSRATLTKQRISRSLVTILPPSTAEQNITTPRVPPDPPAPKPSAPSTISPKFPQARPPTSSSPQGTTPAAISGAPLLRPTWPQPPHPLAQPSQPPPQRFPPISKHQPEAGLLPTTPTLMTASPAASLDTQDTVNPPNTAAPAATEPRLPPRPRLAPRKTRSRNKPAGSGASSYQRASILPPCVEEGEGPAPAVNGQVSGGDDAGVNGGDTGVRAAQRRSAAAMLEVAEQHRVKGEVLGALVVKYNSGGVLLQTTSGVLGFLVVGRMASSTLQLLAELEKRLQASLLAEQEEPVLTSTDMKQCRRRALATLQGTFFNVSVIMVNKETGRVFFEEARTESSAADGGRSSSSTGATARVAAAVLEVLEENIGNTVVGTVVDVNSTYCTLQFGVQLESGSVVPTAGTVHKSQISWEGVVDPASVFSYGQEVSAVVIEVDRARQWIQLSVRHTRPLTLYTDTTSMALEPARREHRDAGVVEDEQLPEGVEPLDPSPMPAVTTLCNLLMDHPGINSAQPGRKSAARASALELRVMLKKVETEVAGPDGLQRFEVLVHCGLERQSVVVQAGLDREAFKDVLADLLSSMSRGKG